MSSDNHKAYVAIPMDVFSTENTAHENNASRSVWTRRNYLLAKIIVAVSIFVFMWIIIILRMTHHHHGYEMYGWNEVSHDSTTTYGQDVVVMQYIDPVELPVYDDVVFEEGKQGSLEVIMEEEAWFTDENDDVVVFDGPAEEPLSIEDVEEVWDAEEMDIKGEQLINAVDEPLEFFASEEGIEEEIDTVERIEKAKRRRGDY